jgi:hypothetical protein
MLRAGPGQGQGSNQKGHDMVTITGPGDFLAHVSAGPNRQVLVSAAKGDKAANFHVKVNDEVDPVTKSLRAWLGFGDATERKIVKAILEERANGAA